MCCLIYKFLLILTQKMQISFLKILPENALKFVSKKMRICVKNFAQLHYGFECYFKEQLAEKKKGRNHDLSVTWRDCWRVWRRWLEKFIK